MQINDTDFRAYVVNKPWGYEYLTFENDNIAIWVLHLDYEQSTSLHCHTKKLTGLICLDGEVQVSFIKNKQIIKSMDKVMIRPTLFHSSKSLSKKGSVIIEIETPVDKDDLVRLRDSYGRENKSYESKEKYRLREEKDVWLNQDSQNVIAGCKFKIIDIDNKEHLLEYQNSIFVVLEGKFINERDGKKHDVIPTGACLYSDVYKQIIPSITLVEGCKVLILERE
mgnify:CR=1 FL=1